MSVGRAVKEAAVKSRDRELEELSLELIVAVDTWPC